MAAALSSSSTTTCHQILHRVIPRAATLSLLSSSSSIFLRTKQTLITTPLKTTPFSSARRFPSPLLLSPPQSTLLHHLANHAVPLNQNDIVSSLHSELSEDNVEGPAEPSPVHDVDSLQNGSDENEGVEERQGENAVKTVGRPNLSVKEKKELNSYAHSLGKKLKSQQVGKSGVTDTVAMALVETLEKNELLKLKIHSNCPGELEDVVKQLEEATGSVVVGQIGRTVILYRPSLSKLKAEEKKAQAQAQAQRVFTNKQPLSRQGRRPVPVLGQDSRRYGRGRRRSSRAGTSTMAR